MPIQLKFILPGDGSPQYDQTINAEHVPDVGEMVGIQPLGDGRAGGTLFRMVAVARRKWYVSADGAMRVECWLARG